MKRVVRDVIQIVTTIRWLPEDGEHRACSSMGSIDEQAMPLDTASDDASQEETADSTDPLSMYVCYTYILLYCVQ